jgi:hypothetical protein
MLAEMLAATVNPNMAGGNHVANYVEAQVIDWQDHFRFPARGQWIAGQWGSMANLVGLAVARNTLAGFDA